MMRAADDRPEGLRMREMIIVLWRAALRISEALALQESDLDRTRSAVLVRRGKGGKRREVGMDRWAWEQLDPWLEHPRRTLSVGALFCVLRGPDPQPASALHPGFAPNCATRHGPPGSGGGSCHISSVTPMRSRWPARESRWWSSSGSSGIMRVILSSDANAGVFATGDFRRRGVCRLVFGAGRCG